jgi:hypothetical protein
MQRNDAYEQESYQQQGENYYGHTCAEFDVQVPHPSFVAWEAVGALPSILFQRSIQSIVGFGKI